jgi:DNA-binding response OmpR family regulator
MRVLLVEDDAQLRTSIVRGLHEAGYDVDEATDVDEAGAALGSAEYDVVVLDILIPGGDGVELCRNLRAREIWTPVLMLTALDAVEDRIRGLDAGADDYLPKPFDFGELLARLRALARRPATGSEAELRVADLVVDLRRRRARRGDRTIELTAKEFDLLAYLARNAGRVVPREELVEHVWDDRAQQSNVIDVYASRLRRKLQAEAREPLLATLRGVGYVLESPPTGP